MDISDPAVNDFHHVYRLLAHDESHGLQVAVGAGPAFDVQFHPGP
jgi:hypothetical protein